MEFADVLKLSLQNDEFWYSDPKLGIQINAQDLIGPYDTVSNFCKKYGVQSFGVFNLASTAAVIKELKFLKMRKVITVEKMLSLYNMAGSPDDESKKLAEKIISTLMERTK
jgi:hypothetical protein